MRIVKPGSPNYDQERRIVNKRINWSPAAILFCSSVQDVQQAVAMAKNDGKKIRIRSTGHSYEGFSMGENDTYVIDVRDLNDITVDAANQIARIGGGSQLYYDVYLTLWSQGKFVIPGGSCPTVGITGLFAGGGLSFSGRKFGLTCDSIVEFDIVTADGSLLSVNSQQYEDLFWACRGGGNGNFGVITSLKTKLYPANDVSIYKMSWNVNDKAPMIATAWSDMMANSPRELMPFLKFSIGSTGPLLSSFGQFYGKQSDLEAIVNKYLGGFGHINLSFKTMSNIDAIAMWGGVVSSTTQTVEPEYMIHHTRTLQDKDNVRPGFIFDGDGNYFKATSIMLDRFFNADELSYIQKTTQSSNKVGTFILLDGQQNGYSSTLPADYNAYAHRKAISSVQIYTSWTDTAEEQDRINFIGDLRSNLENAGKGAYVNYCDTSLKDYPTQYYGDHYQKLQQIKQKYDPSNIFSYTQSIAPQG